MTIEKTTFTEDGDLAIVLGSTTEVRASTATLIWPPNRSYRIRDEMSTEIPTQFTRRATFDGGTSQMETRTYRFRVNYSVDGETWTTAVANMSLPLQIEGDAPEDPEQLRYE